MFSWNWLDLPRWTSASQLGVELEPVTRGLFGVGSCMYALTNANYGTPDDPGVGGFLWARSRATAILVYDRRRVVGSQADDEYPCTPPPPEILGFQSLTFAEIRGFIQKSGQPCQISAEYAFPTGEFTVSRMRGYGREFIFSEANPLEDDPAIAIIFHLAA
jgi:hypothetical protein